MIRPVVACVVFDAVGTPTAGSFQRKEASRDHRGRDHIMKRFRGALCWIVLLTVIVPVGYRATGWLLRFDWRPKTDALASEAGRDLFLHEWTPGDPLAARGDGLGPVFNASSCAACHQQGGIGGSGSQEHNVTVFTRAPKPGADATRGVIHQFAIDAASQETLQNISAQFPKKSRPTLADLQAVLPKPANPAAGVQTIRNAADPGIDIGQRNTPALFGASVIDAIPDAAILANERNQHLKLGLSVLNGEQLPAGRAAKLSRKRVGKFGWKANIGNLPEFVRVACTNELGLGNPLQAQPASLSQPGYRPRGLDLTDQQCDQMTAFIASLPLPREVIPPPRPRPPAPSQAKSTSSKSAASTATVPILPTHKGSTAICCCTRWGKDSAPAAVDSMENSRRIRQRIRTSTVARRPQANGARRRCGVLQIPLPIFTTAAQRPWPRPSSCTPVKRRRP